MSRLTENELSPLLRAVAQHLADKIAGGEASASDISNAIKLLKDNNITASRDGERALGALEDQLRDTGQSLSQEDDETLRRALEEASSFPGSVANA